MLLELWKMIIFYVRLLTCSYLYKYQQDILVQWDDVLKAYYGGMV